MLSVEGLLCCAGTLWGPVKVPSAGGDSAGQQCPEGSLTLLGASSGHHNENSAVIFCHFKLDFKSQVGFRKLIQFFSLRGIDLLPRRLRRDYKTCSGFPSETQEQAWATVTSLCLHQAGSGASLVLSLQGAVGEIPSCLLTFLLP